MATNFRRWCKCGQMIDDHKQPVDQAKDEGEWSIESNTVEVEKEYFGKLGIPTKEQSKTTPYRAGMQQPQDRKLFLQEGEILKILSEVHTGMDF